MERKVRRIWPRVVQNVGRMRDAQAEGDLQIKAICNNCRTEFVVDLDYLVAMRGRGYSLINKKGQCKRWGCGGRCTFLYRWGAAPFFPLLED